MDNISYEKLLIMQATIESNRQESDEKMKNLTEDLIAMITSMLDQINFEILTIPDGFTKGSEFYHFGPR